MNNYLTYVYLLTPLHTGASSQEGNLMGIAREVHTEFPYLPASSLRGKIRSELETLNPDTAGLLFGQKIKDGMQPTEGEVWFADATLLFFPIASLSHHFIWITCPLWLERWNRWLDKTPLTPFIQHCRQTISDSKPACVSFPPAPLYLQTALLKPSNLTQLDSSPLSKPLTPLIQAQGMISQLTQKLVILSDEDCNALVELGLQREVRVALEETSKTVKGGSFRSEEAIPPEAVLFFPWGMKQSKHEEETKPIRRHLKTILNQRLQFGGLEGLGRGWADLQTIKLTQNLEM
ncbi:MAG: type III-B CRISPR module RAMP protein Cmr4 [Coleofasciculus sp. C1-SOL-03]|uniref:type III-B CRISPR module RAMP protein Cmr4 n=1 Tax=Coleofasciculus sp. C1-SOL-03 TaxID=3069522 RepID=UPI003304AF13